MKYEIIYYRPNKCALHSIETRRKYINKTQHITKLHTIQVKKQSTHSHITDHLFKKEWLNRLNTHCCSRRLWLCWVVHGLGGYDVNVRCIWSTCTFDQRRCVFDQICCAFGQLRKPNPNPNLTSVYLKSAPHNVIILIIAQLGLRLRIMVSFNVNMQHNHIQ